MKYKKAEIIRYYDKYVLNEMDCLEIAKKVRCSRTYVNEVMRDLTKRGVMDSPIFWDPERKLKIPPCVGHEFEPG